MIPRELVANAGAFSSLTALRLHDVLLWLSSSLRLTHAVTLGRGHEAVAVAPSSREE